MDSPDLESLFLAFDDKIANICAKLALLNIYNEQEKFKCLEVNNTLGNIQYMLHTVNQLFVQLENNLDKQTQRCAGLLQLINDHLDYVENNYKRAVDDKVTKSKPTEDKMSIIEIKKKLPVNAKNNVNKNTVKTSKSCSEIAPITAKEYATIPKYMLGRLSLDLVNESVQAFNQTIANKYMFIKNYNTATSNDADFKRFQEYKSHEMAETKGEYFCTINDIKELSGMKNDATLRKVLTCLRHCKRITEIRGNPPKLIRYCMLKGRPA